MVDFTSGMRGDPSGNEERSPCLHWGQVAMCVVRNRQVKSRVSTVTAAFDVLTRIGAKRHLRAALAVTLKGELLSNSAEF